MSESVVDAFHRMYYDNHARTWDGPTRYRGHKVLKCPLDLWIYHEIIQEVQPDLIIECGTAHGGSALWFCDQLDLFDKGEVVTLDVAEPRYFPDRPQHPRLTYLQTSSTNAKTIADLHARAVGKQCLVILDSDHCKAHVLDELDAYASLTPVGGYLIVEDTNVHGHPVLPDHAEGPMEALNEWLPLHPEFEVDHSKHKFYLTFNPCGYLRRTS